MEKLLLVFLGGGAGAVARYGLGAASSRLLGPAFPYGTLAANVIGGLLMGVLMAALMRCSVDQERWRLLLGVGVLGGFTTFSAFSLETARMIETRALGQAALYTALSVGLSIAAVFAGMVLTRKVFG